jgi:inner membrane protein
MDPITQGALGAVFAQSAATRQRMLAAGTLGFLSGMAPDLDVLIRSSTDPLLFLQFHRQFTHALAFIPLGALVCATVLFPLVRRWLGFGATYLFCLLGYATHGLLDACTSYGTQLLWPFADTRIAWNLVAVVDPLLSLPLAGLLIAATIRRAPKLAAWALAWVMLYLGAGALQQQRTHDAAQALAASRSHQARQLSVKPSFGNLLVWKSIYLANGRYHVDALRTGIDVTAIPGTSIARLDPARDLPWLDPASRQAQDLERFRWFSADYLALQEPLSGEGISVIDVRYSMVPNEVDAMWGIRLQARAASEQPVEFFVNRRATERHRAAMRQLFAPSAAQEPGAAQ